LGKKKTKRGGKQGGEAQVLKNFPQKQEALSSIPNTEKKKVRGSVIEAMPLEEINALLY
jgi:hypothetical protein